MSENLRDYNSCSEGVKEFYRTARSHQTVEYVLRMHEWYTTKEKKDIDIWESILLMSQIKDNSDPDIDISNINHLFQVAESMRESGLPEWVQVVGLIHDLGKIMYLFGTPDNGTTIDHQWGVVGDTFLVGCKIPDGVIFPEFNNLNPDMANPKYNTSLGMYKHGIGLDNCLCSWGHDEYLYRVLLDNNTPLAQIPEAMAMIRYHSLYPWHTAGCYGNLVNTKDKAMLPHVNTLNKHDLYTKVNKTYKPEEYMSYYLPLLHKFIGTSLKF